MQTATCLYPFSFIGAGGGEAGAGKGGGLSGYCWYIFHGVKPVVAFVLSYLRFCVAQGGGAAELLGVSGRSCVGNGDVTVR